MTNFDSIDDLLDAADHEAEAEAPRPWTVEPGQTFHAIAPGVTVRIGDLPAGLDGAVLERGQTVVLTAAMIEGSLDRNGDSWMSIVNDEDAQVARWGERRLAPGRAPAGMTPWTRGSVDAELEADRRRRAVALLPEAERAEALDRITAEFGRPRTAQTLASYRGDDAR